MSIFDFLSGQNGQQVSAAQDYGQNGQNMQQYQPAFNTGQTQGMNYSQVLGGGQAQPQSATQGLDFSKIGQWALNQQQVAGASQSQAPHSADYGAMLKALGGGGQTGQLQGQAQGGQMGRSPIVGRQGQYQPGQNIGYIGSGNPMPTSLPVGLLSQNRY